MNIFTQKFIRSTVQGFTLVETLAATFVITVVILGPLTVAINASAYARETKDTMIATYLAEEALELLHHQQDSVYLRCVSSTNTNCTLTDPDSDGIYESPKEAAWRIFRARLAGNAQGADCFASAGCSYDMIHFTTNGDANPTKYVATDTSCNSLSVTTQNTYVCSGVPSHVGSGSVDESSTYHYRAWSRWGRGRSV